MITVRNCLLCGVTLFGLRDDAKFCSDEHRIEYHNLHRKLHRKLASLEQLQQEIQMIRHELRHDIERGRVAEVNCEFCGALIVPGFNSPDEGSNVCDWCYDRLPGTRVTG